jgi:hypothetical protein
MANALVCGSAFAQFLVNQEPVYDKLILADIRPTDGWIGNVDVGTFDSNSGTQHTLDRFNAVFPNTTKTWRPTAAANCLGTPCDKIENNIGWGASRLVYFLEEQSWSTPLLCYDQDMHVTHAKEHFRYIISDILKPATSAIMSNFLRKRTAQFADKKWVASALMSSFTYQWVLGGTGNDEEIYIDTDAIPTSKLTPQMLQRRVEPLMRIGYMGKQPFKDMPPLIELITDMETCWELDRLGGSTGVGGGGNPSVAANWRFEQWDMASKYWRYGFSGQIGNFAVRVDPLGLRFNYVGIVGGKYRFQVVLPYKNVVSSGAGGAAGIKSVNNDDYDNACYGWSYIFHRKGIQALVSDATPINPEMPFSSRNFGGKWQFVMDNLGTDASGCVIENKRRNKGQFIADFKLAIRPQYTEFLDLIFHMREPACVIEVSPCKVDCDYPTQSYSSENEPCPADAATQTITPVLNAETGTYEVQASTIKCDGGLVSHAPLTGTTTLAALAAQMNIVLASLVSASSPSNGFSVSGGDILLTGSLCGVIEVAWLNS